MRFRWIAGAIALAACAWLVSRASIVTDITAFLPGPATPQQRLLAEQLRDGVAARLVLVGIDAPGAAASASQAAAAASRRLAAALRADARFAFVANGEAAAFERERALLFDARYLLSPEVSATRFATEGLRAGFERLEALLSSSLAPAVRPMAAADPTGEMLALVQRLSQRAPPVTRHGVWFTPDGRTALLLVQTAAPGFDVDAQQQAAEALRAAFESSRGAAGAQLSLQLTGPGVFAVESRARIQRDAERLSLAAALLVSALLLFATRSPRFVVLALLPVATGAMAGLAAIAAGFGAIHGITLGFGLTLIGEAVDYAIYVYAQRSAGAPGAPGNERLWRSLWLAVLTSAAGFVAMILSGFRGLAQLGVFSLVGIVVAGATARWLLPSVLPAQGRLAVPGVAALARSAAAAASSRALRGLQVIVIGATLAAAGALYVRGERAWNDELAALSPLAAASGDLDARLRGALAAPELRWLVAIERPGTDAALAAAEAVRPTLDKLRADGALAAFDSPADLVPSAATQAARRAALPPAAELQSRLQSLLARGGALGNFEPAAFQPFVRDVERARTAADLAPDYYRGTALGQRLAAQLVVLPAATAALITLSGVDEAQAPRIRRALAAHGADLIDLKGDVERLIADYRRSAAWTAAGGGLLIVLILALRMRDAASIARVVAVLATSTTLTAFVLVQWAGALTLFHLVALLLVVGVGSNYALFLTRMPAGETPRAATIGSVLLAGTATLIAFALLALSATPVLHMIGLTVAVGAVVALLCAAAFAAIEPGSPPATAPGTPQPTR
jgi:predicted exporter